MLLALCSLAFAPAPLPRPDRGAPARKRERSLAECRRRLDELGVQWRLEDRGGGWRMVCFSVRHPRGRTARSSGRWVSRGDLLAALRAVIADVEAFFQDPQSR